LLIEAPMGEGKTEAALFAARHWIDRFEQPGMYLGLPTQATSNAMYERVDAWIDRLFGSVPVESLLVHGGIVRPEYYEKKKMLTYFSEEMGGQYYDEENYENGRSASNSDPKTTVHEWFLPSKR